MLCIRPCFNEDPLFVYGDIVTSSQQKESSLGFSRRSDSVGNRPRLTDLEKKIQYTYPGISKIYDKLRWLATPDHYICVANYLKLN